MKSYRREVRKSYEVLQSVWYLQELRMSDYVGKNSSRKNMPVDPTMISYRRPGAGVKAKEKIVTQEGEVVCADKVSSESAEGFGYISHFATCKARNR